MSPTVVEDALGGLPALLTAVGRSEAAQLGGLLRRQYVGNALPAEFLDGVLLCLFQANRRRYPLYFHAARLLAHGASLDAVKAWLDFDGWQDTSLLMSRWRSLSAQIARHELTGGPQGAAALLAGTIVATSLDPTISVELHPKVVRHLPEDLLVGVRGLRQVWTVLHSLYCGRDDLPLDGDPVIAPWRALLAGTLDERGRVLPSFAAASPRLREAPEGRAVTEDVGVTLLESFPVGVIRLDEVGRIVYENPALREIVGAPSDRPSPAMGARLQDLPNVRASGMAPHVEALVRDGTPIARTRFEFTSLFGKMMTLTAEARPIWTRDGQRSGSVVLLTDVTREIELGRQLVQSQKMEMFGTLVGGIAHDLNNLLVGVRGHASLLAERLGPSDPNQPTVVRLDQASQRLSAVVDGLLALARPGDEAQGEAVDCAAVLRQAGELLSGLLPPHVELRLRGTEAAAWGRVGKIHLEQVFVNVCVNSRDAILAWGDGRAGHIDVAVHPGTAREPRVTITIADDGAGMSAGTLAKVFEPFFTTKASGRGTGLGMPVSLGIVRSYGGDILATSEPGQGATFTVMLPAAEPRDALPAPEPPRDPSAGVGSRVLVVDDNEVVRTLCAEVLRGSGYDVTVAENGHQARAAVAAGPSFAAAVVDVGLPDVDGTDLAHQLGGVPVLLMSGNPPESFGRDGPESAPWRFLKKPFALSDLLQAVAAVMAEK